MEFNSQLRAAWKHTGSPRTGPGGETGVIRQPRRGTNA